MGQYFSPCITRENKRLWFGQSKKFVDLNKKKDPDAYKYYEGVKLMEHSWVGNFLTNAVCANLYNNPGFLMWVGDYADDEGIQPQPGEETHNYTEKEGKFNVKNKLCVNLSKNQFFIFRELPLEETYLTADGEKIDFTIFPLSLLTAVGNGNGGGDYYGKADKNLVGSWAGDEIVIRDNKKDVIKTLKAEKYQQVYPNFSE